MEKTHPKKVSSWGKQAGRRSIRVIIFPIPLLSVVSLALFKTLLCSLFQAKPEGIKAHGYTCIECMKAYMLTRALCVEGFTFNVATPCSASRGAATPSQQIHSSTCLLLWMELQAQWGDMQVLACEGQGPDTWWCAGYESWIKSRKLKSSTGSSNSAWLFTVACLRNNTASVNPQQT